MDGVGGVLGLVEDAVLTELGRADLERSEEEGHTSALMRRDLRGRPGPRPRLGRLVGSHAIGPRQGDRRPAPGRTGERARSGARHPARRGPDHRRPQPDRCQYRRRSICSNATSSACAFAAATSDSSGRAAPPSTACSIWTDPPYGLSGARLGTPAEVSEGPAARADLPAGQRTSGGLRLTGARFNSGPGRRPPATPARPHPAGYLIG